MLLLPSVSSLLVVVATDPASGARAMENVTEEAVPRFEDWSQVTGRASGGAAKTSAEQRHWWGESSRVQ